MAAVSATSVSARLCQGWLAAEYDMSMDDKHKTLATMLAGACAGGRAHPSMCGAAHGACVFAFAHVFYRCLVGVLVTCLHIVSAKWSLPVVQQHAMPGLRRLKGGL